MRKLLYIALTFLLLASCAGQRRYDAALQRAQAILNDAPDSALALLDSLESSSQDFSKSNLRRWQLLRLSAQNKCDTVFRSDSLQLALTDYYDRHGTPNERMTAYYLLGRAYSDMGEAPQALESFQKAIECADTTDADCDFNTMYRIYGQMAMLFRQQYMPDEELQSWEQYSTYALRAGNMYDHIRGIELTISPYFDLDDTIACLKTTELCHQLYLENGMEEAAASVYPTAIYIHLLNEDYLRARELMRVFETQSSLFDSSGTISSGREAYYYSKGLLYMGVHQTDSAEYFFRRLLGYHINKNYEAYSGLLSVYESRRDIDSVMKYSTLCEQALDSIQAATQSETVAITNSLYNYNRLKHLANIKEKENARLRDLILAIVAIVLALVCYGYSKYIRFKKNKQAELVKLDTEYTKAVERYNELNRDLQLIQSDKDTVILEKQNEISKLQTDISKYKSTLEGLPYKEKEVLMLKDGIVSSFKDMSKGKRETPLPSDDNWIELEKLFMKNYPQFYLKIILNESLGTQEKRTCMLSCLYFKPSDIAVLLNTSPQRITNVKTKANFKLFGQHSASSLINNLRNIG